MTKYSDLETPGNSSFSDEEIDSNQPGILSGSCYLFHSFGWRYPGGVDNKIAEFERALEDEGGEITTSSGNFRYGKGPNNETVSFKAQLYNDSPGRYFWALTVAIPKSGNYQKAKSLRDNINDELVIT